MWPSEQLGDLFEIGAGKSVTPGSRIGEGRHPFLRTSNVLWGKMNLSEVDAMHYSSSELLSKTLLPGDLLVCEGGEIGRAAIWRGEIEKCGFQNHLHRLRSKHADVLPCFFMYYLQAGFTQLGIYEGVGNKTTIPNLSRSRLAALDVPKPSKDEQEKIAAVLWKTQKAVELEEKLAATARELKAAAMRRLFSSGSHGEPPRDTAVGPVPKSWAETSLGRLSEEGEGRIQTGPFGSQLHAHEYQPTGIPVVNPTHLAGDTIDHASVPKVSEKTADRLERHKLRSGDILFARRGEIGRHGLIGEAEEGWLCGTGCFLVRVKSSRINNAFLSRFLSVEGVITWLNANAAGVIMPNLNNAVLANLPIFYPESLDEQHAAAAALQTIDRKIAVHERRAATLRELFASLLHRLMTGEMRVDKLDIDVSEVRA